MLAVTPRDWGNIIREHRQNRGLTQAELAQKIGVSRQWVVRFENGHAATATLEHLLRLSDALLLDIDVSAS